MGRTKKLKNLNSIIKDKAKIIKAKFSITNHTTSSIQIAVIRATTRSTRSPPHQHLISALVSFGHTTSYSASACIQTIINRLHHHHEPNAYVTLKSLITLHNMITSGSFVHPVSNTGLGFLNLSRFMDNTDAQSREFSLWAQWYARYLENNLCTSNIIGCDIFLSSKREVEKRKEKIKFSMYMDLFKEIKALVSMIEVICTAPKSLHCQTNDIIYEVMRLVGEDYRMLQHHTLIRLTELNERVQKLNSAELNELTQCLTRLESCKGRLTELFVNRGRNVSFWDFESELMEKVVRLKQERDDMKSVSLKMIEYVTESTQLNNKQISRPLRILPLVPFGQSNNWSNFEKVNPNICSATA
ncbi:ENTH/VHS and ANTH domains-containing protein [Artemisia annua]|uniref:ENTH/VHS and ANTH domains-containing protein n=1 Tax=Artemisia annua TaxID=35608 RepID=A0A2U1PAH6_ARTAN|nr:ENTH/VHS and ANTH domains-containing protein [Artemisia annua]